MSKKIIGACLVSLLVTANTTATATESALEGGSGLVNMRTAETLEWGAVDLSTFGWVDTYLGSGSNDRDSDFLFMPGVNYGVYDNLEVGLGTPVLYNIDGSEIGLKFVRGIAKYRFIDLPEQGVGVALSAYGAAFGSGDDVIGSGDANYGVELNVSLPRLLQPVANFHLLAGYEKGDTKQVSQSVSYTRDKRMRFGLGLETAILPSIDVSLEVLFSRSSDNDDNAVVIPGLRYAVAENLSVVMGLGLGIPKDVSDPEFRILGGISYSLHKPSRTAETISRQVEAVSTRMQVIEREMESLKADGLGQVRSDLDELASEHADLQKELQALQAGQSGGKGQPQASSSTPPVASIKPTDLPRVEVLNASGIAGLAGNVARQLKMNDYNVVRVGEANWSGQAQSQVLYRANFDDKAIDIAHDIPGNQTVFIREDLPDGVEIQVIVGKDQQQ